MALMSRRQAEVLEELQEWREGGGEAGDRGADGGRRYWPVAVWFSGIIPENHTATDG